MRISIKFDTITHTVDSSCKLCFNRLDLVYVRTFPIDPVFPLPYPGFFKALSTGLFLHIFWGSYPCAAFFGTGPSRPLVLSMKRQALLPWASIPSSGLQKHTIWDGIHDTVGKAFAPFIYRYSIVHRPHSFSPRPSPSTAPALSWVDLKRDRPHFDSPPIY